jgi:hypothetical protein
VTPRLVRATERRRKLVPPPKVLHRASWADVRHAAFDAGTRNRDDGTVETSYELPSASGT